jgi:GTPase
MPVLVKPDDDVGIFAESISSDKLCPIFSISNVTGEGLNKLKEFMSMLSSRIGISGHFASPSDPVEFLIDGVY